MLKPMVTINVLTWMALQIKLHQLGMINSVFLPLKDILSSWYFRLYRLGYIFRVTGHHEYGWKADSINLYQGEFYNGLESFAYDDKGVLEHDNMARLVVLVLVSFSQFQYI